MPFRTEKFITRQMLRDEPETLFVFGDNVEHQGYGGQAGEMRDEPNAVGIPTKWRPSMNSDAFFGDRDYVRVHAMIFPIFQRLSQHLAKGGDVVWPENGIGTGRAQLKERAPQIAGLFEMLYTFLKNGAKL